VLLSGGQIRTAVEQREIIIDPYDEGCVQPASYDLRVGPEAYTSTGRERVDLVTKGLVVLEPGDFAMVVSEEHIELDMIHAGRFGLRSVFARKGIFAAVGPQIDPGFKGRLLVGLINLSPNPTILTYKDHFVTVEFHRLNEPVTKPYCGPYQGRDTITSHDIEHLLQAKGMVYSEVLQTLSSLNKTVAVVAQKLDRLDVSISSLKWFIGASIALFAVLVGLVAIIK
jgi:dCTP deaminase